MKKKVRIIILSLAAAILVLAVLGLTMVLAQRAEKVPVATPEMTPESIPVPTPTPSPEPTLSPEEVALQELREEQATEDDFLLLVNPWNQVPLDYEPEVESIWVDWQYDIELDARCEEALMNMYHDCQAAGGQPFITSAYRTYWVQYDLYDGKIIRCIEEDGISEEDAPTVAAESVAIPGTSEHELGLAFDIIDLVYTELDDAQMETFTQQWLMEHCWEYGFILRYPSGTSDITGIIFEPWHYRYVGKIAAEAIHERGITLEEYLDLIYPDNDYKNADNSDKVMLDDTYTARKAAQWNGTYSEETEAEASSQNSEQEEPDDISETDEMAEDTDDMNNVEEADDSGMEG